MRVLHFHIKADERAVQYIAALSSAMEDDAEMKSCHSLNEFKKTLASWKPHIVHIHGAWRLALARAEKRAIKSGARVVVTPHGQLEPWIIKQKYWTDKLPKLLIYQRSCIHKAYSIIAMGRMEAGYLARLGYNNRIETILNSLFTETISNEQMAHQVYLAYQKVLDTDVMELMKPGTQTALRAIIKAGITNSPCWLSEEEQSACNNIDAEEWHKIVVFSCNERINHIVDTGVKSLGMAIMEPLTQSVDSYNNPDKACCMATDDELAQDPDAKLITSMKASKKQIRERKFGIGNLIDMARLLRLHYIDEEKVTDALSDKKLTDHAARIMQLLADLTGLEEGFMLMPARNDKATRKIEKTITKHISL